MRTRVSNSMLRARASLRLMPRRTRRLSCSCEPIRRTGLSAVIGSWKIMAMPVPNSLRTSSRDISESTLPSKVMRPSRVMLLPVSSPIAARDKTVFPEPDSPTIPILVPASISRSTPRTASSWPRCVAKRTLRFSSLRIEVISCPRVNRAASGDGPQFG